MEWRKCTQPERLGIVEGLFGSHSHHYGWFFGGPLNSFIFIHTVRLGFATMFHRYPLRWADDPIWPTNIFQLSWNHQPVLMLQKSGSRTWKHQLSLVLLNRWVHLFLGQQDMISWRSTVVCLKRQVAATIVLSPRWLSSLFFQNICPKTTLHHLCRFFWKFKNRWLLWIAKWKRHVRPLKNCSRPATSKWAECEVPPPRLLE